MLIQVTENDILQGRQCSSERCAVAMSLKRIIKDVETATVSENQIVLRYKDGSCRVIKTPDIAAVFIKKFDYSRKDEVKPFNFEVPDAD
jgi:hypothetical protein